MASRNLGWTGTAGDGDFNNALNWQDFTNSLNPASSPPTGSDFVSFGNSTGGSVNFDGGSAETLNVFGTATWSFSGALSLSGEPSSPFPPYAFTISAATTFSGVTLAALGFGGITGPSASDVLTVEGGSTVSTLNDGIGTTAGQSGSLALTGTNTTWHVVHNAAYDNPPYVTGYLTVGGGAATSVLAGGVGSLTIESNAAMTVDSGASVGQAAGSQGTVAVSSGGSWTVDGNGLIVGQSGTGSLTVGAATGTSTVSVDGPIYVGQDTDSSGTVTINAGGTLEDTEPSQSANYLVQIGYMGTGAVTVSGTGALLNTNVNPTTIGWAGTGSLTVSDGGTVDVGTPDSSNAGLSLGRGGTGSVTVDGAGSSITVVGNVIDGRAGTGTDNGPERWQACWHHRSIRGRRLQHWLGKYDRCWSRHRRFGLGDGYQRWHAQQFAVYRCRGRRRRWHVKRDRRRSRRCRHGV